MSCAPVQTDSGKESKASSVSAVHVRCPGGVKPLQGRFGAGVHQAGISFPPESGKVGQTWLYACTLPATCWPNARISTTGHWPGSARWKHLLKPDRSCIATTQKHSHAKPSARGNASASPFNITATSCRFTPRQIIA